MRKCARGRCSVDTRKRACLQAVFSALAVALTVWTLPARSENQAKGGGEDPARYYFDHGAEQYTRDDLPKARAWIDEGLLLYPEDRKLLLLRQLLEQQQQSVGSNNRPDAQRQSPDSSPQQQPSSAEEQQQAGSEPQQPQAATGEENRSPDEETAVSARRPSSRMSREEAERLLDALKDREAAVRQRIGLERALRGMHRLPPPEKDW